MHSLNRFSVVLTLVVGIFSATSTPSRAVSPDEARGIAKDAFVYAYSMLYNYKLICTEMT